jgi:hypothetical protein
MQAINPLELVSEAVAEVQKRFYKDFPPHADEAKYNYKTPSTMKVTRIHTIHETSFAMQFISMCSVLDALTLSLRLGTDGTSYS